MKTNKNHGLTKPQDSKTFWSSVASVMVRSTAFGVSQITTGLRVGACNKLNLRINPFPFSLVKVLRRWSTAAPKMSRRWDRDTILNQKGLQNGITEHIVMCMARFQWHVQNIISLCASFVSPFSGVGLLNLETRFKSSIKLYLLWSLKELWEWWGHSVQTRRTWWLHFQGSHHWL